MTHQHDSVTDEYLHVVGTAPEHLLKDLSSSVQLALFLCIEGCSEIALQAMVVLPDRVASL